MLVVREEFVSLKRTYKELWCGGSERGKACVDVSSSSVFGRMVCKLCLHPNPFSNSSLLYPSASQPHCCGCL